MSNLANGERTLQTRVFKTKGSRTLRLAVLGLCMTGLYACSGDTEDTAVNQSSVTANNNQEASSVDTQATSGQASSESIASAENCAAEGDLSYVCGLTNAE